MTERKFYKTTFQLEILSMSPLPALDLPELLKEAVDGEYSANFPAGIQTVLDGKQAAEALQEQGSSPEFFNLNEEGEDYREYADEHQRNTDH